MKSILIGLFIVISMIAQAQWSTIAIKDEFDEPTGEIMAYTGTYYKNIFDMRESAYLRVNSKNQLNIVIEEFIMPEFGQKGVSVAFKVDNNKPIQEIATVENINMTSFLWISNPKEELLSQLKTGKKLKISIKSNSSSKLLEFNIEGFEEILKNTKGIN